MIRWRDTATAVLVVGLFSGPSFQAAGDHSAPTDPSVAAAPEAAVPAAARVVSGSAGGTPPTTTLLDGAWNTGFYTATIVDDADTTHVSYYADGTGSVQLASCDDPCIEPTVTALTERPGIGTDLVQVDQQLLVSFLDLDTRTVQLARCALPNCDAPQVHPVAAVAGLGPTHLGVTPDGDLVLAYPGTGGGLTVAWCEGTDCRNPTEHELVGSADHSDLTVDTGGRVWIVHRDGDGHLTLDRCTRGGCEAVAQGDTAIAFPSVAVAPTGGVAVSYHASATHDLRLLTCTAQAICRDATVDGTGDVGYFSAVVWRPDGYPLIAHRSESDLGLVVADCQDPSCEIVAHRPVDLRGAPGEHLSVALDRDGTPRIAHHDAVSRTLRLTSCVEGTCASPPGAEHGGASISVAVGADGRPVVAWRHPDTMDLRLSPCAAGPCPDGTAVDSGGDVGLQASLTIAATPRVLHRDPRTGTLRLVVCDVGCGAPRVSELEAPGAVASLSAHSIAGQLPTFAVNTFDGGVHAARCEDPSCATVSWQAVGAGRPGGPVAAVPVPDIGTAVVHAGDAGATVSVCAATCASTTFGDGVVTAVHATAQGARLTAAARDVDGRITVGRCRAACTTLHTEVLAGHYDHLAMSATEDGVTLAAVDPAGTVTLFDCADTCVAGASFAADGDVRHLDVLRDDGRDVVAILGAQGPTVALCDTTGCVTRIAGDEPGPGYAPSVAGQQ